MDILWLLALHLGPLHPVEKILTLVLAFGPFVLLGVVILVRRRSEDDLDGEAAETASEQTVPEETVPEETVPDETGADAGLPRGSQRER